MHGTQKLSLVIGLSLIFIACQSVETLEPENLGEVSQGLSLGTALGTPVVSGNTCGLNNGIAPACASSNASDISHTWTPPSSGTFTFSTTGSDFQNVLLLAPFSTPFSPIGCNSNGTSSSLRMVLNAGQQYIITVDGFAALCGNYQLNITQNCVTSSCTTPPPCGVSPGFCNGSGTCSYSSRCGGDEVCRAGSCVARCLTDPHFPC
jgi:hypothetical protein